MKKFVIVFYLTVSVFAAEKKNTNKFAKRGNTDWDIFNNNWSYEGALAHNFAIDRAQLLVQGEQLDSGAIARRLRYGAKSAFGGERFHSTYGLPRWDLGWRLQHQGQDSFAPSSYVARSYLGQEGSTSPFASERKTSRAKRPTTVIQPYPVPVVRRVPYPVETPVPYPVVKKVPVPYPVERAVPYPVAVPVFRAYPVPVPRPYPVHVDRLIPYPVQKIVHHPIKVPVPVPQPYAVHVRVPVPVERIVRVPVPVYKPVPYEVVREVPVPYRVPVDRPVHIHVPDVVKAVETIPALDGTPLQAQYPIYTHSESF